MKTKYNHTQQIYLSTSNFFQREIRSLGKYSFFFLKVKDSEKVIALTQMVFIIVNQDSQTMYNNTR